MEVIPRLHPTRSVAPTRPGTLLDCLPSSSFVICVQPRIRVVLAITFRANREVYSAVATSQLVPPDSVGKASQPGTEVLLNHFCSNSGGKTPNMRSNLASTILGILTPLSATFMAWKGLCVLTNSPVPVVCVISESMAPAFHRGDILFLWNRKPMVEAGDIPVVWFEGNPLPMVHRVVKVFSDGRK